jgi:nuclear GTP-binding protein
MGKLMKGAEPDINTTAKMVLNDWQRGKLPFYVAPEGFEIPKSKIENVIKDEDTKSQVTEDAETRSIATAISESVLKGRELQQLQDFRKIRVGLEYEPEDIKQIDPEVIRQFEEAKKITMEEKRQKKNRKDDDDDSSGISDFYSEDEYDEKLETVVHRPAGRKIKEEKVKEVKTEKKLKTSSGFFNVEEINESSKKISKGKKKITAKQKRALDRKEKVKKIGTNFYDVVNVKNKTNSKKFGTKK